ncbi:GNAT family N-acetyltransferase [Anaerobacillus alkalidiazotrophicus]|uniref:GNAT family N-acetyltransferase n=1 Tax=Anaerobacillus alkalidiazotrophicus TaxID=472963 RepID=A0A1S2M4A3_9BACI|nr:GNAT family protein [Anaerobacillus alkalidiazotrophicus]OIJ19444.1 GNAT family N-acetyltransferase [Anaerobacillus alkalidiazotrophicus]
MTEKVKLRAFEQEDIKHLHKWYNNAESIFMVGRTPMTFEETEQLVFNMRNAGTIIMGIENNDEELVGWIHLSNIVQEHGRAEIGILMSPDYRGHGYGKSAMKQMIEMGFNQLRLNKIYLTTRGINERAIALYKKLGFILEGSLRQHSFIDGKYVDTIFMGLLLQDWRNM